VPSDLITVVETLGPDDMARERSVTGIPNAFLRPFFISSNNTLIGVTKVIPPRSSAHRAGGFINTGDPSVLMLV